jgi:hypothetical protein
MHLKAEIEELRDADGGHNQVGLNMHLEDEIK